MLHQPKHDYCFKEPTRSVHVCTWVPEQAYFSYDQRYDSIGSFQISIYTYTAYTCTYFITTLHSDHGRKHPLVSHLHKMSAFPPSKNSSTKRGNNPFISRLQSPIVAKKVRSKSASPPLLGRLSPFTQMVNSNSWSTYYSEESIGNEVEPLLPKLCIHRLWEGDERLGNYVYTCSLC